MYNPAGADVSRDSENEDSLVQVQEYVEIYNSGSEAVDLTGWTIRDEDANSAGWGTLSGMLQPGQAGVLTWHSEEEFRSSWSTANDALILSTPEWGTIANNVTGTGNERLVILDDEETEIDVADYLTVAPWPDGADANGNAIYLLPGFISQGDNDLGANWAASALGVDGAINPESGLANFNEGSVGSPGTVVVPEPSTYALLFGAGAFAFLLIRRRRQ